jgi:Brp/Blh family beta-carotene 15,15'-monooxygenase
MSKSIFIFFSCVLLLTPFFLEGKGVEVSTQFFICLPFLLLIGIPHGAIDNILYLKNSGLTNSQFISIYLLVIALNICIWLITPIIGYGLFLIISAFHFGQSQFTHYFVHKTPSFQVLSFFWGVSILSGLIYFNADEIIAISVGDTYLSEINALHKLLNISALFFGSTIISILLLCFSVFLKKIKVENLLMETLVLLIILVTFYLLPLLISFSLYFIILHSHKVLKEEYYFLKKDNQINNFSHFVKILAPLTLLSIFGILLIFALIKFNFINISYGYSLFLIISSITLPHVFVMNRFYKFMNN